MKKVALVATLTAACGLACAQSNVTVYGILDTAVLYGKFAAGTSLKSVAPNAITASRLGFRGSEDLGDGLRANFQLEHGFFPDTGTPASATSFWSRGSWVSLSSSSLGEVRLGRQRSPLFWLFLEADFSGYGIATLSSFNILHGQDALYRSGTSGFYDNSVNYRSTALGKFSIELAQTLGTEQSGAASRDGRMTALTGQYRDGPLWGGLGFQHFVQYNATLQTNQKQDTSFIAGKYKFNAATVGFDVIHATRDITGRPASSTGYGVQAKIRAGDGDVDVGVATLRESGDRRATAYHLGYIYQLSLRTGIYGYAGLTKNNENASYTYSGDVRSQALSPIGFDPRAITVGIRHGF